MSYYFKQNRTEYYDRLMDVRKKGNWEDWIKFFLRGVAEVADESTASAKAILRLKETCSAQMYAKDGNNSNYQRLLNVLFERPYIQRNDVVKIIGVSNPTAGSILDTFCEEGILLDLTPQKSRNKLFMFTDYIAILNKGTELVTETAQDSRTAETE